MAPHGDNEEDADLQKAIAMSLEHTASFDESSSFKSQSSMDKVKEVELSQPKP